MTLDRPLPSPRGGSPWPVRVAIAVLVVLAATLGALVLRNGDRIDRLERRLAVPSGPADRASTHEALAALRGQIEALSGRILSLESAGPLASDDPEAAARLRDEWQAELDSLRAELEAMSASSGAPTRILLDNGVATDTFLPSAWFRPATATIGGNAPSWSASQALGPPDTEGLGDFPTAWASQQPDGGLEWLEVTFPGAYRASGIVIVESYNPGAVAEVEAAESTGGFRTVWSGIDPATSDANELEIPLDGASLVARVRITLDTRLVPGWNEIDAVGLIMGDTMVWGTEASASSSFGGGSPSLPPQPIIRIRRDGE